MTPLVTDLALWWAAATGCLGVLLAVVTAGQAGWGRLRRRADDRRTARPSYR